MDTQGLRAHVNEELARQWGERVRTRREELHLSLGDVAELIDSTPPTSVQTLSKLELGQIIPRIYLQIVVAAALQVDATDLFPVPPRKHVRRFLKSVA